MNDTPKLQPIKKLTIICVLAFLVSSQVSPQPNPQKTPLSPPSLSILFDYGSGPGCIRFEIPSLSGKTVECVVTCIDGERPKVYRVKVPFEAASQFCRELRKEAEALRKARKPIGVPPGPLSGGEIPPFLTVEFTSQQKRQRIQVNEDFPAERRLVALVLRGLAGDCILSATTVERQGPVPNLILGYIKKFRAAQDSRT
ncbi:MAG: hypothetical protein AB7S38_43400 [Vulcanimicrobiota bacterium]